MAILLQKPAEPASAFSMAEPVAVMTRRGAAFSMAEPVAVMMRRGEEEDEEGAAAATSSIFCVARNRDRETAQVFAF